MLGSCGIGDELALAGMADAGQRVFPYVNSGEQDCRESVHHVCRGKGDLAVRISQL